MKIGVFIAHKKELLLNETGLFYLGIAREPLPQRRLLNLIDLNFYGLRGALGLQLKQVDTVAQMGRNFNS